MDCQVDRYAIYDMIAKRVSLVTSDRSFDGLVEDVFRNILDDSITIEVDGASYAFAEPTSLLTMGSDVVFCYGTRNGFSKSDDVLFDEMRDTMECVDDVIRHHPEPVVRTLIFSVI